MNFKLSAPYYLSNEKYHILPTAEEASGNDLLFVMSSDEDLTFAVYNGIAEAYDGEEPFMSADINAVVDKACVSAGQNIDRVDLAVVFYHVGACLVSLRGRSRILQVRDGKVVYDSRSQVLDVYAAETKVMQLDDVQPGDVLVMEMGRDKFDVKAVARVTTQLGKPDVDVSGLLNEALGDSAQSMAFVISQVRATGEPLKVKDLNRKWWLIYALLIALLFGLVYFSLNGFGTSAPATQADSTVVEQSVPAADSVAAPQPLPQPKGGVAETQSVKAEPVAQTAAEPQAANQEALTAQPSDNANAPASTSGQSSTPVANEVQ